MIATTKALRRKSTKRTRSEPRTSKTGEANVGSPRPELRKAFLTQRAARLAQRTIEYMPHRSFAKTQPEQLPPLADETGTLESHRASVPKGVTGYIASLYETPLLGRDEEAELFRRMNLLKYWAAREQARIDLDSPDSKQLDRIEDLLRQAHEVRDRIIRANLRLVVSIAKRFVDAGNSFHDMVSEGNVSLMRAVEKFDYSLGYRFSTYATWAVRKNLGRLIQKQQRNRSRFVPTENALFKMTSDPRDDERSESKLSGICAAVFGILEKLSDRERAIVRLRYGLDEAERSHTLQEIATDMGVCKERVRQLELRALRKLQAFAVAEKIEPPRD